MILTNHKCSAFTMNVQVSTAGFSTNLQSFWKLISFVSFSLSMKRRADVMLQHHNCPYSVVLVITGKLLSESLCWKYYMTWIYGPYGLRPVPVYIYVYVLAVYVSKRHKIHGISSNLVLTVLKLYRSSIEHFQTQKSLSSHDINYVTSQLLKSINFI